MVNINIHSTISNGVAQRHYNVEKTDHSVPVDVELNSSPPIPTESDNKEQDTDSGRATPSTPLCSDQLLEYNGIHSINNNSTVEEPVVADISNIQYPGDLVSATLQ